MKRAVLLALALGGCSWLLGGDPERVPKCSNNSECASGTCMTFGVGSNNGTCMPLMKSSWQHYQDRTTYDKTVYGKGEIGDCITIWFKRRWLDENGKVDGSDHTDPEAPIKSCRIGSCCAFPRIRDGYEPCPPEIR
jgi:hypothetical protein